MISLTNCNFNPIASHNFEWIEKTNNESLISIKTYNYLHVERRKKKNNIIKFKLSNFVIKNKLLILFNGKTSISMKYILHEFKATRHNIIEVLKKIANYDPKIYKWRLK